MLDRRTFLASGALVPLAACTTQSSMGSKAAIKIVTFNIWHDAGDWATRRTLIADVLRKADPDIIAFQEILQDSGKNLPNQAETFAQMLTGYSVHFMSTSPEGAANRYGNAILSRLPVVDVATKKLEPLNDYRTAIRVRVRLGARLVDIVNTHLAHQADAGPVRAQQIGDMLAWLPTDNVPLVIAGDFNAPLTEPALATVMDRGLESALPAGAAATTLVTSRGHSARVIDHIFFERGRFVVADAHIIADQPVDGEYPSDHFGVSASLLLK